MVPRNSVERLLLSEVFAVVFCPPTYPGLFAEGIGFDDAFGAGRGGAARVVCPAPH